ncbi:MAG: hypothetical protein JWM27_4455 [Gemmatimonadetes bacterium]|nr:hypothetical protein [Gemmatimonadota bacterium]
MIDDMDRVVPLDQLDDFQVADGDPDPRGWDVIGADGAKIGEVDEMLVDTRSMRVRYLDVEVDDEAVAGVRDRHVLIPIGTARLDEHTDCVHVEGLSAAQVGRLPQYNHAPLTRDFETSLRDSFEHPGEATPRRRLEELAGTGERPDDFYAGPLYDDTRFYGRRRGDADAG